MTPRTKQQLKLASCCVALEDTRVMSALFNEMHRVLSNEISSRQALSPRCDAPWALPLDV